MQAVDDQTTLRVVFQGFDRESPKIKKITILIRGKNQGRLIGGQKAAVDDPADLDLRGKGGGGVPKRPQRQQQT